MGFVVQSKNMVVLMLLSFGIKFSAAMMPASLVDGQVVELTDFSLRSTDPITGKSFSELVRQAQKTNEAYYFAQVSVNGGIQFFYYDWQSFYRWISANSEGTPDRASMQFITTINCFSWGKKGPIFCLQKAIDGTLELLSSHRNAMITSALEITADRRYDAMTSLVEQWLPYLKSRSAGASLILARDEFVQLFNTIMGHDRAAVFRREGVWLRVLDLVDDRAVCGQPILNYHRALFFQRAGDPAYQERSVKIFEDNIRLKSFTDRRVLFCWVDSSLQLAIMYMNGVGACVRESALIRDARVKRLLEDVDRELRSVSIVLDGFASDDTLCAFYWRQAKWCLEGDHRVRDIKRGFNALKWLDDHSNKLSTEESAWVQSYAPFEKTRCAMEKTLLVDPSRRKVCCGCCPCCKGSCVIL